MFVLDIFILGQQHNRYVSSWFILLLIYDIIIKNLLFI